MRKSIILLIIALSLLSIACSKNKDVNTASGNNRVIDYREIVKIRTIQHIKKYGLKKVLINKEIKWWGPGGKMTLFKNDGTGYYNFRNSTDRLFYWKVINNKLYINPNKQLSSGNKFVLTEVEPVEALFSYPGHFETKDIKYALIITGPNESFSIGGQTSFKKIP